jgi:hypothetical protein
VAFRPRLNGAHYAELMEIVGRATTQEELRDAVAAAAERWNCEVDFDDPP